MRLCLLAGLFLVVVQALGEVALALESAPPVHPLSALPLRYNNLNVEEAN